MAESDMRERVESLVADIPPGRVMTYGDVAAWCGYPGAARRVGAIAASGTPGMPWHRVVRSGGYLACSPPSCPPLHHEPHPSKTSSHEPLAATSDTNTHWQEDALKAEGIAVQNGRIVAFIQLRWEPTPVP